jgi:hypothetical protein
MTPRLIGLTTVLVLGLTHVAGGQQPSQQESQPQQASSVDVSRLPVNLGRIQKQLQQSAERQERQGLNLRYTIEVYGRAPRIQLFTPGDNLSKGPAPYGAPTHSEILQVITPQEFRAPAMDFGALLRWLKDREKK